MAGSKCSLELEKKSWGKFERYLANMRGPGMKKALNLGSYKISNYLGSIVAHAYAAATYKRHDLTLAAYLDPATGKAPWKEASPLTRSGSLSKGVEVVRIRNGVWSVQIDPNAIYDKGDPQDAARGVQLAKIAEWMEFGKEFVVKWTPKMRAYMAMLSRKHQGGSDGGSDSSSSGGGGGTEFLVKIPPKPIWGPAFKQARKAVRKVIPELSFWLGIDKIDKVPTIRVRRRKIR